MGMGGGTIREREGGKALMGEFECRGGREKGSAELSLNLCVLSS